MRPINAQRITIVKTRFIASTLATWTTSGVVNGTRGVRPRAPRLGAPNWPPLIFKKKIVFYHGWIFWELTSSYKRYDEVKRSSPISLYIVKLYEHGWSRWLLTKRNRCGHFQRSSNTRNGRREGEREIICQAIALHLGLRPMRSYRAPLPCCWWDDRVRNAMTKPSVCILSIVSLDSSSSLLLLLLLIADRCCCYLSEESASVVDRQVSPFDSDVICCRLQIRPTTGMTSHLFL